MAIFKILSSLSLGYRGKRLNVKINVVDLPLSPKVFKENFPVDYCGEPNFKSTVSVSELNKVFGTDWHLFQFPNSMTRRRILGVVILHYRKKTLANIHIDDSR